MQTTLVSTSPVDTVRIEESDEKIVVKDSSADVEAIQDILMEMADMRYPVYPSLVASNDTEIEWYVYPASRGLSFYMTFSVFKVISQPRDKQASRVTS